jgi:formate hydrogenlyase subunit 3/multisubunit Na+/H+ antiporter MnhD subunit
LLWYLYIYYLSFLLVTLGLTIFFLRIYFLNFNDQLSLYSLVSRIYVLTIMFVFFVLFLMLNYLLDYYSDVSVLNLGNLISINLNLVLPRQLNLNALSLNLVQVYYYPFIYVFLLITILSIVFCLTYNYDELFSFMFYCQIILLAGYVLFFTDSLILFFLSYEMLLVPSFFILYKFAKTRRCVEAAYLMFFWTQFGALFLIFAFLYMFIVCGNSSLSFF